MLGRWGMYMGTRLKRGLAKYVYSFNAEPAMRWVMVVVVRGSVGTYSWEAFSWGVMGVEGRRDWGGVWARTFVLHYPRGCWASSRSVGWSTLSPTAALGVDEVIPCLYLMH